MKIMRLFVIGMLIAVSNPIAASATRPFPNTFIQQQDGKWVYPRMFTCNLVVVDRNHRHELALKDLFPGKDYDINVAWTTAGPLWGDTSLYYITELDGESYFTMHTCYGKRLLVKLDTGTIENPDLYADALREADKKEIRVTLADVGHILTTSSRGFDEEKLHGAMLLAAKYKMADVRPNLEIIEERGWHGPSSGCNLKNMSFGKGLSPELQTKYYKINEDRRFAQLALRRLGFSPKGYPQIIFEEHKKKDTIAPTERLRRTRELKAGLSSQQVYNLLGPPDYLQDASHLKAGSPSAQQKPVGGNNHSVFPPASAPATDIPQARRIPLGIDAWRFDFGPKPDFSLIIIWNNEGKVGQIKKVSPGLWHGDELFDDKESKPAFRLDGSFLPSHHDSKAFLRKAEDFLGTKPK